MTSPPRPDQSETILVVEDDDLIRAHVVGQLTVLGYRALEATCSEEALEILRLSPAVDLLFTDLVMPSGMHGCALAEAACTIDPALKVLFTSGYSETALKQNRSLPSGAKFLGKPYRRAQLAAALRTVLETP